MLVYGAGAAWSRLFMPGAGADPIYSEPESAPGTQTSGAGAAKKNGGSATLVMKQGCRSRGQIWQWLWLWGVGAGAGAEIWLEPEKSKMTGSGNPVMKYEQHFLSSWRKKCSKLHFYQGAGVDPKMGGSTMPFRIFCSFRQCCGLASVRIHINPDRPFIVQTIGKSSFIVCFGTFKVYHKVLKVLFVL